MGTSAEALKRMSCFKIELIIILRLTGQRMEPENKKKTWTYIFIYNHLQ